MLDSKTDQKRNLKAFKINVESNLNLEAPPGGPRRERTHPRDANEPLFGPGIRSLCDSGNSETTDLGDLEAKDLDSV